MTAQIDVRIPSPLRSYTGGAGTVTVESPSAFETVGDILGALDERFPGIRFRVVDEQGALRPHVNVWLDSERVRALDVAVGSARELTLMQALSGGT